MRAICAIFLAGAFLFTAAPSSAESLTEKTGINALIGASPSSADFVTEAAIGGMFETESSELAAIRADDDATRSFAAKMNEDHQKASSELSTIVKGRQTSLPMPSKLDNKHRETLDKLRSLHGDEFVKQYYEDQISAHKDATALLERYAQNGDDRQLKAWAQKTLPVFREHLDMALRSKN